MCSAHQPVAQAITGPSLYRTLRERMDTSHAHDYYRLASLSRRPVERTPVGEAVLERDEEPSQPRVLGQGTAEEWLGVGSKRYGGRGVLVREILRGQRLLHVRDRPKRSEAELAVVLLARWADQGDHLVGMSVEQCRHGVATGFVGLGDVDL